MKPFITLWKFSRPHTIIGSAISIFTLFYIVCENQESQTLHYLILALCIGISCNVFIVGINQIADVQIDKINKPHLPIASGALSIQHANVIVFSALLISLGLAFFVSYYLFGIIALATTIGWAYSMPPFYLKKHHITAALSIAIVRGILLNAGGFLVFNYLVNNTLSMPENVQILTLFIFVFSIVISWFKDLPDIEGDLKYKIQTFAILYSPKFVLRTGNILVGIAYLITIYVKWVDYSHSVTPSNETSILLFGHIIILGFFMLNAISVSLREHESIKKFYRRFWYFFFAEYALYFCAYAING